ncbi:MAG TPA: phosphoribosyltransferase family protein [Mucilaginibacter sp.]
MNATYSLHHITSDNAFGFDPDDYSRFKFGDDAVAKEFGTALADGFIGQHIAGIPAGTQLVVISSPYSFIPTATFAMKNWFVYRLNRWLAANNYPVVQETKVHRTITYKEDYGELDAQARINLIGNDLFHIDKQFLEGKTLVFLDDIKITGSHERMIMKMVGEYGLKNDIYMLYFAELVNKEIHPSIENFLNYHQVKTIFDLEAVIKGGSFAINTRIVKYILNYNFDCFRLFIGNQTDQFINLLYDMALGNGYHSIDAYAKNLNFIAENLFTKHKNLLKYGN